MVRKLTIAAMAAAVFGFAVVPKAAAGWTRHPAQVGYPTEEAPHWRPDWIIGWRYPYHRVRPNFAPPGCWHNYGVVTPEGIVWRREYICR